MMYKYLFLLSCFIVGFATLFGQSEEDLDQWVEMHNWDGIIPIKC